MTMRFELGGIPVYRSELATAIEPVRKHVKTRSMSETYHQRVQKKWVKRWGEKTVPGAYQTAVGIFLHPELYDQFLQQVQSDCAKQGMVV